MISVILPVYNGGQYLRQTVMSILSSSYSDLEIVAVDDGSTDESIDILDSLAAHDTRIRVYHAAHQGVAEARNHGILHSRGDYLCFCDQDDYVEPFMYHDMLQAIETSGSDMALCSSGRLIDGRRSPYDILDDGIYTGDGIRRNILLPILLTGYDVPVSYTGGNHYPNIWVCMVRKSFWDAKGIRFRCYVDYEDDLLVKTELLCKAAKVVTISQIGYYWRVHLDSGTYSHKYIRHIGRKQDDCLADIVTSLNAADLPQNDIIWVTRVMRCKQYLDAMHNLPCKNKGAKNTILSVINPKYRGTYNSGHRRSITGSVVRYCNLNIYNRDFSDTMKALSYLDKGRVKARFILPLLKHRLSYSAYLGELLLDRILNISLRSQMLSRLERKIKQSREV